MHSTVLCNMSFLSSFSSWFWRKPTPVVVQEVVKSIHDCNPSMGDSGVESMGGRITHSSPRATYEREEYDDTVQYLPDNDIVSPVVGIKRQRSRVSNPRVTYDEFADTVPYLPDNDQLPSNRQSVHRRDREPAKYNGKSDWSDYLKHFNAVSKWNNWTYDEMGLQLAISLTDEAREVLSSLVGQQYDFHCLVDAMTRKYSPEGKESQFSLQLMNRTCSPNEDVTSYSHAIRRLATKAYPGQLLDDKILVGMFIKGLPTQAMKRHVYLAKPSTLAEAINCAVVYEAFDKPSNTENSDRYRKPANAGAYEKIASVQNSTAQNSVVGRQNNDALSTIMATLSTLTKTVDELQKSVGSSTRPQYQRPANYAGRVECFNCRKMGHYAKDCYQAKRPAQNYGRGRNQGQPQGQSPIQCRDFSNVSNTPTTQLN